jgi:hypothetical protein
MNPRYRSFSGALIAIFAVPIFLGLTACLPTFPVPVGNPEKSRIDPYITGIWMLEDEDVFYIFEPYDKRTWVLSALDIYADDDACGEKVSAGPLEEVESLEEVEILEEVILDESETELNSYEELIADLERHGPDCFEAEYELASIKVWRTKLGGEWFMTWEPLGGFDSETGFGADEWVVFRIDASPPNELRLWALDTDHPAWDAIEELDEADVTRRAVEKVIRKNADDESFYGEDAFLPFYRVLPEHYELFEEFIDNEW